MPREQLATVSDAINAAAEKYLSALFRHTRRVVNEAYANKRYATGGRDAIPPKSNDFPARYPQDISKTVTTYPVCGDAEINFGFSVHKFSRAHKPAKHGLLLYNMPIFHFDNSQLIRQQISKLENNKWRYSEGQQPVDRFDRYFLRPGIRYIRDDMPATIILRRFFIADLFVKYEDQTNAVVLNGPHRGYIATLPRHLSVQAKQKACIMPILNRPLNTQRITAWQGNDELQQGWDFLTKVPRSELSTLIP